MADPMTVEVVSADAEIWAGEAVSITARTVDGDIGILPGHEPVLAVLVPGVVEIATSEGGRERVSVAVDGGFLSVAQERVSVLSEYARLAGDVSVSDAESELSAATAALEAGDDGDVELRRRVARATAQVKAAQTVRTR